VARKSAPRLVRTPSEGPLDRADIPWDDKPGWLDPTPAWLDELTAWIAARVESAGPVSLKRRRRHPWSVVGRVPTPTGPVWFKEVGPGIAYEPALTETLARHVPQCLPEIIAAEGSRLLTARAGRRLDRIAGVVPRRSRGASAIWSTPALRLSATFFRRRLSTWTSAIRTSACETAARSSWTGRQGRSPILSAGSSRLFVCWLPPSVPNREARKCCESATPTSSPWTTFAPPKELRRSSPPRTRCAVFAGQPPGSACSRPYAQSVRERFGRELDKSHDQVHGNAA
jgi:hypothetical protein